MPALSDDPTIYEPHNRFAPWHYDGRLNVLTVDCMRETERLSHIMSVLPSIESQLLTRRDRFFIPPAAKVAPTLNSVQAALSQLEPAAPEAPTAAADNYCTPCDQNFRSF